MDYLEHVKKNLKMKDIAPAYQEAAEIIGIENYINLCEGLGGGHLYLPTLKELCKNYVYAKVIQSKDVLKVSQLSKMYGISEATVYRLIRDAKHK